MAIDITISLVKYSHASPPPPGGQLHWEHLFPGDLFLLLRGEGERPHGGALTCQVVYGSKVVVSLSWPVSHVTERALTSAQEHIDIAACVDRASNVSSRLRSLGVKVQREQLPIFGIVKDAVLAIRHQRDGLVSLLRGPRRAGAEQIALARASSVTLRECCKVSGDQGYSGTPWHGFRRESLTTCSFGCILESSGNRYLGQ